MRFTAAAANPRRGQQSDWRGSGGDDHSSRPVIADRLKQPTRKRRTGRSFQVRARREARRCSSAPLFGLAPCGVLPAICLTADAVRSYRTFSPLPTFTLASLDGRYIFCATSPSSCPDRELPGALPCGVRTFLPPTHPEERAERRSSRLPRWNDHCRLSVGLLGNTVLLQLLVQVAAGGVDDLGGAGDVPGVFAEFLHEPRTFGGLLELAQRPGR